MGIEPTYSAWEADVLPLNYTRGCGGFYSGIIRLMIEVRINGAPRRFQAPLDVATLLSQLEMAGKKVAVERNGEIVPKSAHARTLVADGDQLEIVVAVGGG